MFRALITLAALFAGFIAVPLQAQDRPVALYIFGTPEMVDPSGAPEAAMPHWLAEMAREGGRAVAIEGQWGGLAEWAAGLPPAPEWDIPGVPRVNSGDARDYDAVILAADAVDAEAMRDAATIVDWVRANAGGIPIYLYQQTRDLAAFDAFLAALAAARPEARLIPIHAAEMAAGADDPFRAGAQMTYATLFDADPPGAAPAERARARRLAARTDAPALATPPREASAPVALDPSALPPGGARPIGAPALAMGLNGVSDWSTQHPFIDVMKTAREWIGHRPGQFGGVSADEMRAQGVLSPEGWPLRMPDGAERLETLFLTDQPEEARHLRGHYVLRYEGQGRVEMSGRARRVDYGDGSGTIRFHYTPGEGPVGFVLHRIDPDDPIRNVTILREEHLLLHEAGAVFNPDWLARIADLRALRFMDWMHTNGAPVTAWEDRPRLEDYTWTAWGVPHEVMIRLANEIGADPWFTMPHLASDDYVRRFAEAVRDGLDPRLKAYVEYSNEVWNTLFPQAQWAAAEARALWGESSDGWMQYYGLRAAQVMDLWTEVFAGDAPDRLIRVMATQTAWPGLEEAILSAPLAQLAGHAAPVQSFDAYAVTGYFGHGLGGPERAADLESWLDAAETEARATGEALGLSRVALREHVGAHRFDAAVAPAAQALAEDLADLTDRLFPYHAEAARAAGLALIMYEGGSHVAAPFDRVEDARLTAFFERLSYSPEMGLLYQRLLNGWTDAGGRLFNAFVDVAAPGKWGSWGALRHLDDGNPRWDVLMAHNAGGPVDWQPRAPEVFANGAIRAGTAGPDAISGTVEEDVLLGGPGDDLFLARGGADRVHGGPGRDRVEVPGVGTDYDLSRKGRVVTLRRGWLEIRLTDVEEVVFTDAPERVLRLD